MQLQYFSVHLQVNLQRKYEHQERHEYAEFLFVVAHMTSNKNNYVG